MLSLMVNTFKYVFGYEQEESAEDIDKAIAQLENAKNNDKTDSREIKEDGEGCFHTTGYITCIKEDYVLIDDRFVCDQTNTSFQNLQVGDKIYYLAYQKDGNTERKIRKIISIVDDESWDNAEVVDGCSQSREDLGDKRQIISRSTIGKVIKRDGRNVYVDPPNIQFHLDKVNSEFIPMVGDWLKLESLVEVDEDSTDLCGEVLEIDRIQPLRSKLSVGMVTTFDSIKEIGVIDQTIIFNKKSCEVGYMPVVGDKVVSDSIESDQGIYTWRSLTVVPLIQVADRKTCVLVTNSLLKSQNELDELTKDKYGIVIADDLKFNLNVNEEADLVVLIQNTGNIKRTLQRGFFMSKKAQSQLSLVWPTVDTVTVLNPTEAISYIFKCKAKFVGTSEELFIFSFKSFKIGRVFRITVNAKRTAVAPATQNAHFKFQNNKIKNNYVPPNQDEELDQGMYIPGIRPCKPPAFIRARNGIFKIPKHYWDVVSKCQEEMKSQVECELAIENAIPCLGRGLSFQTWRDRFHALLYLEEIAQIVNINQYSMDSATMRQSGEYLVLEVPGLAEKRPSLLVGDRAIVSFNWDSSTGKLKYEGYIHKVRSTEIYLKFNRKFHEEYTGEDCAITFKCSPTSMQRCHNAINLAMTHLGADFLFPTKVVQKEPQLILEESEEEKPNFRQSKHKRNDSISSSASSNITNTTLTSDSSSENIVKSPPRISVAERLFNAKPLEIPCINNSPREIFNCDKQQKQSKINLNDQRNNKDDLFGSTETKKPTTNNNQNVQEMNPYISQVKKRKLIWFNKKLNYYQKEAVRNVLKGLARPLPYVIFGPPGTGKTSTLCETALQILTTVPESRLLIATPSNSSANLIAECLLDSGIVKPGDLVRLIAHHCLEDDSIPERLLPYCATGNIAEERTRENFSYPEDAPKISCTMSVLGRHRITVGTCIALGILYNMGFPRGHFSHVLVDEAGQATEPEIMIPLNFIHSNYGQVVLAGDPLQLGPVVQSKLAQHFGFGESFLARLLHQFPYQRDTEGFETGYDPRLVTKLVINYRSLPEILSVSNTLFYDSELQPQVSTKDSKEAELLRLLADELPEREGSPPAIVFHGIIGQNYRDSDSPSWYNPEEATQAYLYLLKFYKYGLTPDDIGIITPYQKQVHQIRDLLMELDVKPPKISSVEGFQGQERKIILLSTVRSSDTFINEDIKHSLGFVASPRRLNVAVTRARALLVILGNPHLLVQDPYWRHVLKYCVDREAYTGCNFSLSYLDSLGHHENGMIFEHDANLDESIE